MLFIHGQEGELTLEGFLALHQMEAEDNQGKEYQLTLFGIVMRGGSFKEIELSRLSSDKLAKV
jgi:hypothetical protein